MAEKMVCDVCKKQFTGTMEQSIGRNSLSKQIVNGVEVTRGLCHKHQWHEVAEMNKHLNRVFGW